MPLKLSLTCAATYLDVLVLPSWDEEIHGGNLDVKTSEKVMGKVYKAMNIHQSSIQYSHHFCLQLDPFGPSFCSHVHEFSTVLVLVNHQGTQPKFKKKTRLPSHLRTPTTSNNPTHGKTPEMGTTNHGICLNFMAQEKTLKPKLKDWWRCFNFMICFFW